MERYNKHWPKIPNRDHDSTVEWKGSNNTHIWYIYQKERILVDRNITNDDAQQAWNFKEKGGKLMVQIGEAGVWSTWCYHAMGKMLLEQHVNYIIECELLEAER